LEREGSLSVGYEPLQNFGGRGWVQPKKAGFFAYYGSGSFGGGNPPGGRRNQSLIDSIWNLTITWEI